MQDFFCKKSVPVQVPVRRRFPPLKRRFFRDRPPLPAQRHPSSPPAVIRLRKRLDKSGKSEYSKRAGRACPTEFGPLAQLGERKVRNLEVRGSSPLWSTKKKNRPMAVFLFGGTKCSAVAEREVHYVREVWLRQMKCPFGTIAEHFTSLCGVSRNTSLAR